MPQTLALLGGEPVRKQPFPSYPIIGEAEKAAVLRVIEDGALSSFHINFLGGERVRRFEADFAAYHGVKYAIAVNSGTAALHVALAAAGIGPGDEVIVPSYTFTATASAVLMHNAIPIFVDVHPHTFCMTLEAFESAIGPSTRAVIPVHLLGNLCRMDAILERARRHHLVVIEDAAQAPGAGFQGRLAGTMGDLGCFSLQETKNIKTGEGGMILTDSEELADRCRLVRNHGEVWVHGKPRSYVANILGWNYRMTEIEAAIGTEQLKHLDEWNDARIGNATFLGTHLPKECLEPPHVDEDVRHVYHVYAMLYHDERVGMKRETLIRALQAEGIPCRSGYPHPLYRNPLFQERLVYGDQGCPFTCGPYKGSVDYQSLFHPVAEALCSGLALWTTAIQPPAGLKEMQDVVWAVEKIFEDVGALRIWEREQEGK